MQINTVKIKFIRSPYFSMHAMPTSCICALLIVSDRGGGGAKNEVISKQPHLLGDRGDLQLWSPILDNRPVFVCLDGYVNKKHDAMIIFEKIS